MDAEDTRLLETGLSKTGLSKTGLPEIGFPATGPVGVIARSASVLRALGETPSGMSLGQIARHAGLPRPTVQRLVAALAAERLVVTGGAGQIALGPEVLRLAASMRADAPAWLRTQMRTLSVALGETVDLSVVRRDEVVLLDQVPGEQRLQALSHAGATFPLYCCASGKAYLAQLSDVDVERLVGHTYPRRAPNTLTTLDALLCDLAVIRRTGVAIDDEEHTEGISAVGIGLGQGPRWFGLSVPMPTQRFMDKRADAATRILALRHAE